MKKVLFLIGLAASVSGVALAQSLFVQSNIPVCHKQYACEKVFGVDTGCVCIDQQTNAVIGSPRIYTPLQVNAVLNATLTEANEDTNIANAIANAK